MLRDRLVCRINNYRIQRRLLAEKDLTFVKALDIATALELAEKSAADLHDSTSKGTRNVSGTSEGDVNFIKQRKSFKDTECWFCHSKGHVQRFCKLRRDQSRPENRNRNVNVNKIPSMSAILKMTRTQKLKCTLCSGHRAKRNLIQCRWALMVCWHRWKWTLGHLCQWSARRLWPASGKVLVFHLRSLPRN